MREINEYNIVDDAALEEGSSTIDLGGLEGSPAGQIGVSSTKNRKEGSKSRKSYVFYSSDSESDNSINIDDPLRKKRKPLNESVKRIDKDNHSNEAKKLVTDYSSEDADAEVSIVGSSIVTDPNELLRSSDVDY